MQGIRALMRGCQKLPIPGCSCSFLDLRVGVLGCRMCHRCGSLWKCRRCRGKRPPYRFVVIEGAGDSPHGEAVGAGPGEHKALSAEADGGRDDIAAVRQRILPRRAQLVHPREHSTQHRV